MRLPASAEEDRYSNRTNPLGELQLSGSIALYRNPSRQVAAAIQSFLSCSLNASLTVVDNSPDDSLRTTVEANGAEYIFNGNNIGFGAAHNIAIRKYQNLSEYHLVLNPDVTFCQDTIPKLLRFMLRNPAIGLVMPEVLYPDMRKQRLCKLLPAPVDLFIRRFGRGALQKSARERMARYLLEDMDLTSPRFVPNLSGCFMFVRMEALRMVGVFDERYFLYLEDVDLCRRIAERWDTVFYPDAKIIHEYGNGSYRDALHLKLHTISAIKYFNKWGWFRDPLRNVLNARTFDTTRFYVEPDDAE